MFGSSRKPYTAVTVQVDRLTSEVYEENDVSGIPDLIEAIRLQDTGPREASRAIRKKLKYGSVHKQLRALTILDALLANAGKTFQRSFADEPLLERLRIAATDSMSDPEVRAKCKILFGQWSIAYKDIAGMGPIASLYRQLPQRRRPVPQPPRDVSPESPDRNNTPTSPTSSKSRSSYGGSSRSHHHSSSSFGTTTTIHGAHTKPPKPGKKQKAPPPFNLEKEKPAIIQALASVSMATTNLTNSLKLINREHERPSSNTEAMQRFENCKQLRRQILRYIQLVESEQYLGSLIHANEELVNALTMFVKLDKPIEEDSDSEDEDWNRNDDVAEGVRRMSLADNNRRDSASGQAGVGAGKGKAPPPPPLRYHPRPQRQEESEEEQEEDDPDNPFGDSNEVTDTPSFEKEGLTWKVV